MKNKMIVVGGKSIKTCEVYSTYSNKIMFFINSLKIFLNFLKQNFNTAITMASKVVIFVTSLKIVATYYVNKKNSLKYNLNSQKICEFV